MVKLGSYVVVLSREELYARTVASSRIPIQWHTHTTAKFNAPLQNNMKEKSADAIQNNANDNSTDM